MMQIGITGQSGFIGKHLFAALEADGRRVVPFSKEIFETDAALDKFTAQCDVIVHLAALHRDPDPEKLYTENVRLTEQLLASCDRTRQCRKIIYTSSVQEDNGSAYGRAKKACREMIEQWAQATGASATTFILPNVFGPGAKPFHTSFIATFSYQLLHGEEPRIVEDREVPLIFIGDLLPYFQRAIAAKPDGVVTTERIPIATTIKVSTILELLKTFCSYR
ncbi:MAG: NAD-dependent epimerase/dehydratase family protein [Candidatus Symbiothrix sp.]|jgi:UDP-2-acetamido-2,6-beta-L-arabino-hexul-4-ose reductase|nr:NAD-dependent epimerase/dehydratase family protein [Candidatus Symbiothrix sp.]